MLIMPSDLLERLKAQTFGFFSISQGIMPFSIPPWDKNTHSIKS